MVGLGAMAKNSDYGDFVCFWRYRGISRYFLSRVHTFIRWCRKGPLATWTADNGCYGYDDMWKIHTVREFETIPGLLNGLFYTFFIFLRWLLYKMKSWRSKNSILTGTKRGKWSFSCKLICSATPAPALRPICFDFRTPCFNDFFILHSPVL